MAGKKATATETPPVNVTPAQDAVENATEALEAARNAADDGDAKEFSELLDDLEEKIKAAEGEIKWLKEQATKHGETLTPMNSTLASLSSEVTDLKAQLRELSEKLLAATQSRQSIQNEPPPNKETPAVAVAGNSIPDRGPGQVPVETPPAQPAPPAQNGLTQNAPAKRFRFL